MRTFSEGDFNSVKMLQKHAVSNKDIAKMLNWSISTVNRAMSVDTYEQHKTRVKVLSKRKKLNKLENSTLDIDKRLANIENGIKGLYDSYDNLYSNANLTYHMVQEFSKKLDNLASKKKGLFK